MQICIIICAGNNRANQYVTVVGCQSDIVFSVILIRTVYVGCLNLAFGYNRNGPVKRDDILKQNGVTLIDGYGSRIAGVYIDACNLCI